MAFLPKKTHSLKIYKISITLLFSCPLLAAQNPPVNQRANDEANFKIAGTVVSSLTGTPLSQARVTLTDTADRRNSAFIITADNGRFTFAPLGRGKYALEGARRGFIAAAYEQHEQFSTAIVIGQEFVSHPWLNSAAKSSTRQAIPSAKQELPSTWKTIKPV